jgi:hydroxymethylpyrimidine pyrophosphatase-like HAD family hydrolase
MAYADIDLVVTDLDGTVWDHTCFAHPRTLQAISRLSSSFPLLAATGRRPSSAYAKMRANGFSLPAVLFDGSLGLISEDGPTFHRRTFAADVYENLLKVFMRFGLEPVINLDDPKSYGIGRNPATHPNHLADNIDRCRRIDLARASESWAVLSLLICGGGPRLVDVFQEVSRITSSSLTPDVRYGGLSLSVRPLGATKWSGVTSYCRQQGLRSSRVLAIADGVNDLELLRGAAVACVPVSACEEALGLATHVLPGPSRGGWADVLEVIRAN